MLLTGPVLLAASSMTASGPKGILGARWRRVRAKAVIRALRIGIATAVLWKPRAGTRSPPLADGAATD